MCRIIYCRESEKSAAVAVVMVFSENFVNFIFAITIFKKNVDLLPIMLLPMRITFWLKGQKVDEICPCSSVGRAHPW